MSTAREERAEVRRELLDRIVTLQMQVQTGDREAREALEEARAALRTFDAESLRLFGR